jgi:glycosyltransferase involved in cell wall biosynthesis
MKVAMVTPYWFPVRGGITTYVAELSEELRRKGHEVVVFTREGAAAGATIVPAEGNAFVRDAAKALEAFCPDAVHAHGHWYAVAAALRYRRRHPRCRVVFTLHTPYPRRSWWRRYGVRLLMSRADFLTGVSADLLGQTLQSHRPRVRTRVTRAGMSVRASKPEETEAFRRLFGLEDRSPIIGYLGRLAWEGKVRGVEQLIRAMKAVREVVPTATLVVGGDGPHRARLEALASAEVPGGAVFLGDIPDPAPRFFTAVDVYAHISYQEGLPLALLEAMACDSAVVASAVGGIPEVIRDGANGFLVANEPAEIAARIIEVLRTPGLRDRLVEGARADITTRFSWSRAADRFLPLFGVPTRKRVVVTVDLERDYQAPPGSVRGVEEAMPVLLDRFDRHGIRATVFATSDLCASHPSILNEVVRRGHELGCHGESHDVEYLSSKPHAWQRASLGRATEAIERTVGIRPRGFRAPNFSANGDTVRVLGELGYAYDSSVLPGRVVKAMRLATRLDFLVAPRDPYRPSREDPALPGEAALWEVPVAENPFSPGGPIGLAYVHAAGVDRALEAVALASSDPVVFLVHPWELVDPPGGGAPAWMAKGCTSDPSKLDAFLGRLTKEHAVVPLADVLPVTGSTTVRPTAARRAGPGP